VRTNSSTTQRRLKTRCAAVAAIILLAAVTDVFASRSDLTAFLERAAGMMAYSSPVRADISITNADGTTSKATAIIDGKSKRLFYATEDGSWRALVPLSWEGTGRVSATKGAKPTAFGPDDRLGNTDLRAIAFFPAWAHANMQTAFVSDNSRLEKTVTLYAPEKDPYMLYVITFDKEKIVPRLVKYYAGQMNNLVRIQKDSDHVMVGARPRPRKIVINNYEDNTETTFDIDWKLLETLPATLLDESTFYTASLDQ